MVTRNPLRLLELFLLGGRRTFERGRSQATYREEIQASFVAPFAMTTHTHTFSQTHTHARTHTHMHTTTQEKKLMKVAMHNISASS